MTVVTIQRAVVVVAAINVAYFVVEFGVALNIGSVSLFADSVDFLEDASGNVLIALAFAWSAVNRARVGMLLAGILLVPSVATLWEAWQKFVAPVPPAAALLSITGAGAFVVNLFCAFLLARFRAHRGSLTRAAFLSARNDAIANVAIIVAGIITSYVHSGWPDLIVGLGIISMNADSARDVWSAARAEYRETQP